MTITGERENRGDDDEVELVVVEGRAQLGQIGLAQDEGAPPATGETRDGTVGAGDDVGADERGDADAHGPRFARPPVPGLRGDGVERGQGGVDPGQDGRAEDGGAGAARIALEQPGSEDLLQAADGVGQRRLGDVVLPGGRAEGAGAGDRLGVAQALGAESIVHTRSLRTDSSEASPPFAALDRPLPARRPRTARRGAGAARWPAPTGPAFPSAPSAPRLRTRAASAPGAPACR